MSRLIHNKVHNKNVNQDLVKEKIVVTGTSK
jgi:hypothetical protein